MDGSSGPFGLSSGLFLYLYRWPRRRGFRASFCAVAGGSVPSCFTNIVPTLLLTFVCFKKDFGHLQNKLFCFILKITKNAKLAVS
jgi:hypothetical protein